MREGATYVLFTALSSMAKIVTVHASSSTNILNNGYYFNLKKYYVAILSFRIASIILLDRFSMCTYF